jgi:hypothetical protein
MGRIGARRRTLVTRRKRRRQVKIKKLQGALSKASGKEEKEKITEKIAKISPRHSIDSQKNKVSKT